MTRLGEMKAQGEKIVCLTAYDASFARLLGDAGVDVILVGDSLGMVIQGHSTTVPVTMEDMIYHSQAVAKGNDTALLMVDMPFMACPTVDLALVNATRLMQEGGAQVVKLEGSGVQLEIVTELARRSIPVCAHLGLQPQSVHKIGGYRVQGRDAEAAKAMLDSALALEAAGADLLLLECVPESLATAITQAVSVPVIGIGAGVHCDGQVLVLHDILGVTAGKVPKFSKNYMAGAESIAQAVSQYVSEVRAGVFPDQAHWFS
ncbi:MAG TPA: 3-methyl-2-oxobutanoate hydroxymethyltransferase [Candidatus Tenderia electrophaga]|uniref:3-methyl-2-oxobutanoate hydroxymethyltransferase n=1 Tax=Candidatus Tenderia electrophaga TaxID=1748243 RepID=A0A832J8G2_9GAMM|nr:3-methyl-2-oxobutanoate hydroxymethyltransferase [Candidatus Tenderia electrophaga]